MHQVTVLSEICKGVEDCGICGFVCPKSLFEPSGVSNQAGYIPPQVADPGECTGCQNCMIFCPDLAIVVQEEASEVRQ